jgi:hypothetical protein
LGHFVATVTSDHIKATATLDTITFFDAIVEFVTSSVAMLMQTARAVVSRTP